MISIESIRRNMKALEKEVPYNQEKMEYKVRLPEATQNLIVNMRDIEKMNIQDIGRALDVSAATVRKVLVQNNCELGNLKLRKE